MVHNNGKKPRIAVIVPARNEQMTIGSVVMLAKKYADGVLVIDDGSTDRTGDIAREAGALVLTHERNMGKGAGIATGLKWVRNKDYDIAVFMDGDMQHEPSQIPVFIEPIVNDQADITIGSRWVHNEGLREMPVHRILGNWILSQATSLSLSKVIRDSQSGFRAFHRRTFKSFMHLSESGFAVESEMIALADKAGFRWIEVGITASYDGLDANTQSSWKHGFEVLGRAMRVLRMNRPGRFFGLLSVILFGFMVGTVIYCRVLYPEWRFLPPGGMFVAASFALLGGFMLFSAIILSGINRVSNRIFDTVIEMIEKSHTK